MKDFVKENWRIAAAFAAVAFFLSLLIGLAARNPFGTVFLRALLLSALFAGLGAGLRYAVRRYLPELVPGGVSPAADPQPGAEGRGATVDIVLPEENVMTREEYRTSSQSSRRRGESPETDDALGLDLGADAGPGGATSRADDAVLDELSDELDQDVPSSSVEESGGSSEDAEEVEGIEDAPPAARRRPRANEPLPDLGALENSAGGFARRSGSSPTGGAGSVAESPSDMSTGDADELLSEETEERPSGKGSRTRPGRAGGTPTDALRGAVSGQDPVTLARAIRTILKKDEKG